MNKIFLNIIVSATGKKIELRVSPKIYVGQLTHMVKRYLKDIDCGYIPTGTVMLCDCRSGKAYSYDESLSELQINDGQEILLI